MTILPKYSDTITAAICIGEVYQENGFNITSDQTAEAGEYSYEILYTTGHCDSLITLQLSVFPKYEETWEDEICEGDNYTKHGFAVSPLETMGVDSLLRTLSLQTVNGCDSIVFLRLSIIDTALRIVSLTADFCEEQSAELMVATQMPDYLWTTGETTPNITVTAPGLYMVTASQNDCHNTAHIRIENCPNELFLPNAISPSRGDGLNDYFCIPEINQRDLSQFEISIYNRWGELVFFSTDKNFKWNGEFRGQIHYETTYVYILQYTDLNGKPHKVTGNITVL